MNDLKKVFNAARSIREQTFKEAAVELGVSESFLHKFFNGDATSAPLVEKVKSYITQSGIIKTIQDQGLDPNDTKKKVATANA